MKVKKNDSIEKICKYCEKAIVLRFDEHLLCSDEGVVCPDHCCGKFSYDPLKRDPSRIKLNTDDIELLVIDE